MAAGQLSESRVLALVEQIHDAAAEPERWQGVADALCEALGGAPVSISQGAGLPSLTRLHVGSGFREDLARLYAEHFEEYQRENRAAQICTENPGRLVDIREHLTPEEVRRTAFYEDWMRPQGMHPTARMGSFHAPGAAGDGSGLGIYSTARSGELAGATVRLVELLDRHLLRAARTAGLLAAARAERAAFLDALDALGQGVFVVDARGRVRAASRAAQEILRTADGLSTRAGELHCATPTLTRRLREAVALAVASDAKLLATPAGLLSVPRPSGARPYQVAVSPLRREIPELRDGQVAALVFVTDPECVPRPPEEALRALYGLTPAEARLAAALASGLTPAEYAEQAGRSVGTIRTQLKQVLAKTGARRQAELVALVQRVLAPRPPGAAPSDPT